MEITMQMLDGCFNGRECFVHARACVMPGGKAVMTMQKLDISGSDLFSPLYVCRNHDGGETWSGPVRDDALLLPPAENGLRVIGCDGTHLYHTHTGKALLAGHTVTYASDSRSPVRGAPFGTFYAVYDPASETYSPAKLLPIPLPEGIDGAAPGCSQMVEKADGTILIPVYMRQADSPRYVVSVVRCAFDGETLRFLEMGNLLTFDDDRGLCEPSVCFYHGRYLLTLRSDHHGLWAESTDGLRFTEPKIWTWDTGMELPTYNTQSHWMIVSDRLFLVYTRRDGKNDHVFRNRAPLYFAQVDEKTMTVIRHSEQIAVTERGARLGNFGVTPISDRASLITAAEWMQPAGCEKYGSDNTIWLTTVSDE